MHFNIVAAALFALNVAPSLGYVYSTKSICKTLLGPKSVTPKTSSYVLTLPITFTKKATVTPTSTITPPPVTTTSTATVIVRSQQFLSHFRHTARKQFNWLAKSLGDFDRFHDSYEHHRRDSYSDRYSEPSYSFLRNLMTKRLPSLAFNIHKHSNHHPDRYGDYHYHASRDHCGHHRWLYSTRLRKLILPQKALREPCRACSPGDPW